MPNLIDLTKTARAVSSHTANQDRRKAKVSVIAILFALMSLFALYILPVLAADSDGDAFETALSRVKYSGVLKEYKAKGYAAAEGVNIQIPAVKYSAAEGSELKVVDSLGGRTGQFLTIGEYGWVEWTVDVPKSGLYNIGVEYYPIEGKRSSIQRDIYIDGKLPYYEAHSVEFKRVWSDAPRHGLPKGQIWEKDNQGNDVRPRQIEMPEWRTIRVEDAKGLYNDPLEFYLSAGTHTIRFVGVREPLAVSTISIQSPEVLPTYAEVAKEYKRLGYKPVKDVAVKFQAEQTYKKSDPTMRPEFGGDALNDPPNHGNQILNEFGGWRWRLGGQWVTYKFTAPKTGLYKIGIRVWNGFDQKPAFRQISIDGKIPFNELKEVKFPYDKLGHQCVFPSDKNGKPFLFYFTKGTHEITLEVKIGPIRETLEVLENTMREMSTLSRRVIMITGADPDPNGEWELDKALPFLVPTLNRLADNLDHEITFLTKLCGRRPSAANSLAMVSDQLRSMAKDPDTIPSRFDEFSNNQSALGTWSMSLGESQLIMEWLWAASPDKNPPRYRATSFEKFWSTMQSFMISFKKDYTNVGSVHTGKGGKTIEVWVARGREWAEIIKDMAEDDFTPNTGIRVNMNVLPAGNTQVLLMSCISGRAPDVALGVPSTVPVDFAIRGALENLNQFKDYKEVAKRFRPGALVPLHYQGGDWAIPEDQDFSMLFWRQDVLDSIGLGDKIPQTWEDVYKILPILQQNGLEFYYPLGNFTPFLFQNGGDYYTKDGLRSALDTPAAMQAFVEYTDLYTKFKLQQQANFYNRMRTGEMPIGIGSYGDYLSLSTAAPELTGWWKMAPMPGHMKPDGTIDRTIGGGTNDAIIFKGSKQKPVDKEAAWEFIKWWTSTDAQVRFGSELEALLGSEARWNTANMEALMQLPWPKEHRIALEEQFKWFREAPYVVGGYFSTRHINNAWNRIVLEGMNPREAVELAVKDIDKELARKQEEFGIKPKTAQSKSTGR